ncbi:glycosyltransferase family 2 protein [Sphaerospermopsis aphanizomenoides BCCUSP55]|uniref:glycosyltransferase family 2 protein n=1 Tax=Sphaerospermopsis aphanizomenoides TaxID=459663 RepID=UPI001906A127|nr:glycosyltransferase family 2 protein [Sphaerospermopsis aphanizomenoides]MBK1989594.1 glycosyltransferase family 2 protein [Sphaerospermopsis aphanizomenoides BCCUSP55]
MPKVSVCIPTYNRANLLPYAVNSVLSQTYTDFELIICDDGSTDHTGEIVSKWDDSRIRYIRQPVNGGRSRNMRSGFEAACGSYFIKFDDDDAITPEFLEKTVAVLDDNSSVDFVCTNHWIINQNHERIESATQENSQKWGKDKLRGIIPDLIRETFINQSLQVGSTLFRRDCLLEVDFMRPQADGCEDFDLLVRLAIAGKQGYFLPEFLMEYRFHGGQTSLKQNLHFLKAKVFCIDSYKFDDEEVEKLRSHKLAVTQQALGLRLIEKGDSVEGRKLLQASSQVLGSDKKIMFGLMLSYLPISLRMWALLVFRRVRPKDYTEQVREASV